MNTDKNRLPRKGLSKSQHLCSRTAIDLLFSPASHGKGGNGHFTAYPWRCVWRIAEERHDETNKILISVPKKKLRHATDRVKMRRRCREAYRLQQDILEKDYKADIAFIYIGQGITGYSLTSNSINRILKKINDCMDET